MTNRVRSSLAGWITAGEDARREEMWVAREAATWALDAWWGDFDE
jgi:hypothetical protein